MKEYAETLLEKSVDRTYQKIEDQELISVLHKIFQVNSQNLNPGSTDCDLGMIFYVYKYLSDGSQTLMINMGYEEERSLFNMLHEKFPKSTETQNFLKSTVICASKMLNMFTSETFDKTVIFFVLLDTQNVLLSHTIDLLCSMMAFSF